MRPPCALGSSARAKRPCKALGTCDLQTLHSKSCWKSEVFHQFWLGSTSMVSGQIVPIGPKPELGAFWVGFPYFSPPFGGIPNRRGTVARWLHLQAPSLQVRAVRAVRAVGTGAARHELTTGSCGCISGKKWRITQFLFKKF